MSHKHHSNDPKVQAYIEKVEKRDRRTEHVFRRVLHVLERVIAAITIVALLGALGLEIYHWNVVRRCSRRLARLSCRIVYVEKIQ